MAYTTDFIISQTHLPIYSLIVNIFGSVVLGQITYVSADVFNGHALAATDHIPRAIAMLPRSLKYLWGEEKARKLGGEFTLSDLDKWLRERGRARSGDEYVQRNDGLGNTFLRNRATQMGPRAPNLETDDVVLVIDDKNPHNLAK